MQVTLFPDMIRRKRQGQDNVLNRIHNVEKSVHERKKQKLLLERNMSAYKSIR